LGTEDDMLYHTEIGFPPAFQAPQGEFRLKYTHHARRAALEDRYGDLSDLLPPYLCTHRATLVEVEKDEFGRSVKSVYRIQATDFLDLVLVVDTTSSPWCVVTCWGNLRTDTHKSLNRSRYATV
jgi:hypothetical protein